MNNTTSATVTAPEHHPNPTPSDPPTHPRRRGPGRWHEAIDLDHPADAVWKIVADYGRDPEWRGEVESMVSIPSGPATAGARTLEAGRLLGMPFSTQGEVLDVQPRHLRWRAGGGGVRASGHRRVEPLGDDRCRLVLGYEVGFTGPRAVMNPVFVPALRRRVRRNLRSLARLLAADTADTADR